MCIGNPERASEYAYRDASISHVKNGIYGAMWVASMISVAPFIQNNEDIIKTGLMFIPQKSRLYESIMEVIEWYRKGISYDEVVEKIHRRWDEKSSHHWCHTISNAQIVATGLLWGRTILANLYVEVLKQVLILIVMEQQWVL